MAKTYRYFSREAKPAQPKPRHAPTSTIMIATTTTTTPREVFELSNQNPATLARNACRL